MNGQVDKALECFRKAVQMDAKFAGAHGYLALHLAAAPDPSRRDGTAALVHARMAVALAPTHPGHRLSLGVALLRTGDAKAALEALEKVDKVATGPVHNHRFVLAMAYWQNGEKDKARRAYEQGVKWLDDNQSKDRLQRGFQAEAAEMLHKEK
jgi:tetratricopeptide (TPR) repeat protein